MRKPCAELVLKPPETVDTYEKVSVMAIVVTMGYVGSPPEIVPVPTGIDVELVTGYGGTMELVELVMPPGTTPLDRGPTELDDAGRVTMTDAVTYTDV